MEEIKNSLTEIEMEVYELQSANELGDKEGIEKMLNNILDKVRYIRSMIAMASDKTDLKVVHEYSKEDIEKFNREFEMHPDPVNPYEDDRTINYLQEQRIQNNYKDYDF